MLTRALLAAAAALSLAMPAVAGDRLSMAELYVTDMLNHVDAVVVECPATTLDFINKLVSTRPQRVRCFVIEQPMTIARPKLNTALLLAGTDMPAECHSTPWNTVDKGQTFARSAGCESSAGEQNAFIIIIHIGEVKGFDRRTPVTAGWILYYRFPEDTGE